MCLLKCKRIRQDGSLAHVICDELEFDGKARGVSWEVQGQFRRLAGDLGHSRLDNLCVRHNNHYKALVITA